MQFTPHKLFCVNIQWYVKIPITQTFGEEKDNGGRDLVLSVEINNYVYAPFTRNYYQCVNSIQRVNYHEHFIKPYLEEHCVNEVIYIQFNEYMF